MALRMVQVFRLTYSTSTYSETKIPEYRGWFHGWGFDVMDEERHPVSVALVEKPNGSIDLVHPRLLVFLTPLEEK